MSETARIFNIQRYSIHDGPGIRTVVFFKGCSLNCLWCSNPESISPKPQILFMAALCGECGRCETACRAGATTAHPEFSRIVDSGLCRLCGHCLRACPNGALRLAGRECPVEEIVREVKKDRAFYTQSGGGVTLSGGEPLLQAAAAAALLAALSKAAIHTAVETAGNVSREAMALVLPHTDLFIYDVKETDPRQHRRLTGHDNALILDNLAYIGESGVPVLIRMPIIPGLNDDPSRVSRVCGIAERVKGLRAVELLPYHSFGVNKHAASGRRYRAKDASEPTEVHLLRLKTLLSERLSVPVL